MGVRRRRAGEARKPAVKRRRIGRVSVKSFLLMAGIFLLAASATRMDKLIRPAALFLDEIAPLCEEIGEELPLILAVIQTESGFRQDARSPRGAIGLMQVMPDTGRWMAERLDLQGYGDDKLVEREWNLIIGISYMRYLRGQFPESLALALAAYNAGPNRVRAWLDAGAWDGSPAALDDIPYAETRNYVRKALKAYEKYRKQYV